MTHGGPPAQRRSADLRRRLCAYRSLLRKRLELVGRRNWRHPTVTQRRVVVASRGREVRVDEVTDCDSDGRVRESFDGPVDGGATRRAEVVFDRSTFLTGDAVDFEPLVCLRFADDR